MTPEVNMLSDMLKRAEQEIIWLCDNRGMRPETQACLDLIQNTLKQVDKIKTESEITHYNSHGLIKDNPSTVADGLSMEKKNGS